MQNMLSGLRIVEGSAFIAAPSGGMTLAQLGADVIRFDPIGGGIDYRRWPVTKDQKSLYWHSLNKGKRSIAVDFRTPEGKELLTQLITAPGEDTGLFVTNFPARGWLSEDILRSHRPDLIYLNLTGDRHGGSALDYTVNSKVGFPSINGFPSDDGTAPKPLNSPLAAWDVIAGLHIALGLLVAERHRRKTGQGQFIKLALADVALATVGHLGYIAESMINGTERQAMGNDIYGGFGHDFVCKDGRRMMLVGLSDGQWNAVLRATQLAPQVKTLSVQTGLDYSREGDRYVGRDALKALIAPWFSLHNFEDVERIFTENNVCWGKYQSMRELVKADPDCSTDNPLFNMVDQSGIGPYLMPGNPLYFGATEREAVVPAPQLGQHTDEILTEILGLSDAQIGDLHDRGIVAGLSN